MHSESWSWIMAQLGPAAFVDGKCIVEMNNSDTTEVKKHEIEKSLRNPKGHIRLVIVSAALGRGANYPAISRVIFLKPPLSLEDLFQFAGRAARGIDEFGVIFVYWISADVPSNRATASLRDWLFCAASACRRQIAEDYFRFPSIIIFAYLF